MPGSKLLYQTIRIIPPRRVVCCRQKDAGLSCRNLVTNTKAMKDQIIREIPLIARYSRHNEPEDYRFRAFVKTGLNLSNDQLDALVRETTDQVWKEIDCTTCANCCKTLRIVVDNNDIRRLAARLGMSFQQFSRKYVRAEADKTKFLAS